ncbi:hypothetical protein CARUB_v10019544mg [Capsella rubella]|uniref:F-box domain-containing protein n=1 Tax=Capsella rubella TaxID=81985 RepID=R0HQ92_9BRAS|nr:F-box protein At3g60790 [Capsella rubella]EOA26118.1 hypothetical protein CARUB_v10019544mg [Capsella rubella]
METPLLSPSSSPPSPASSSNARSVRRRLLAPSSSEARGNRIGYPNGHDIDWISALPDELLEKILSNLPFKSAVKTSSLSRRWLHLWKHMLQLCMDMRFIMEGNATRDVDQVSRLLAESMTKTINNHRGRVESCTLGHFVFQCEDGTLDRWIRTVTRVKHTKELILVNYIGRCMWPIGGYNTLKVSPRTFSHQSLTSLSITRYNLTETEAFKSCGNLKTLKLLDIIADVSILNRIIRNCSSLEMLVLHITSLSKRGVLKIRNKNLEVFQVACPTWIDKVKVNATRLEILDIKYIYCDIFNFILDAPKIRFNRNYWDGEIYPHMSYNISSLAEEKKRAWFEVMVTQCFDRVRTGSLSVRVDVTKPKEVEILKEVLLFWRQEMKELEIIFKNGNAPRAEGESSSINGVNPFPDAYFRVSKMWLYNFDGSNEEEFALASRFVTQGTVTDKLMIETSTYPPMKKLITEAKVAKLMELSQGNCDLTIESF